MRRHSSDPRSKRDQDLSTTAHVNADEDYPAAVPIARQVPTQSYMLTTDKPISQPKAYPNPSDAALDRQDRRSRWLTTTPMDLGHGHSNRGSMSPLSTACGRRMMARAAEWDAEHGRDPMYGTLPAQLRASVWAARTCRLAVLCCTFVGVCQSGARRGERAGPRQPPNIGVGTL
jgi:hypothetical protein